MQIPDNVDTTIYTVGLSKRYNCTINLCNTTDDPIAVRVAISAGNPISAGEYIEHDIDVPAHDTLIRDGLVIPSGKLLVVRAAATGIDANTWGYEE